uniref:Uncharacterized protein n=1 Tax=Panagrolaimus sp. PS1159 TaxID=55785 RepID=A0AC35GUQ0_9BILA
MSVKAYNPVIYQKLGNIGAQSKVITRQDIDGLGKIIVKHGYGNYVCVVIAHRHFDLDDSEVMYEVVDSDCRISQPRPLVDILAEKAQPNLLSCSFDGFWYPVGY